MAAAWNIINDALAMLKEPEPGMRMINAGLMGLLADRATTGPTIIQLYYSEARAVEILTCLCSIFQRAVGPRKVCGYKDERCRVCVRAQRQADYLRVGECEKKSWKRKRFLSSLVKGNTSLHHEPKLSADAYQKEWHVSLLQLATWNDLISSSVQSTFSL